MSIPLSRDAPGSETNPQFRRVKSLPRKSPKFLSTCHYSSAISPPTILSHTWGHESQEVTFEDIVKDTGKHKARYAKIRVCGQVDSYCIDRSNSQELQETIICVYVADIGNVRMKAILIYPMPPNIARTPRRYFDQCQSFTSVPAYISSWQDNRTHLAPLWT